MAMQPPRRPTSRVGPAPKAAAPARPGTGPVPKQAPAPATGRARTAGSSTRSVAKQSGSRPVPKQAAAKSNTPMMIGIGAAVVVILGIGAFAMSGNSEKPATHAPKEPSKPKAVDVSKLEQEGLAKCDEGLSLIKKNEASMGNHSLSDGQKGALKADLEKGRKLISDGMALLTQANDKAGRTYDTKQYQEALITVRKKLMELRD
jgi:hypothetical protein